MPVVLVVAMFATRVLASNPELENLFADDLRYKSCQISLQTDDDGYDIYVRRDCPSGNCSSRFLGGHINVNSQETQSGWKTVKNSLRIANEGAVVSLEVVEFNEWRGSSPLSGWSVFGGGRSWQVGVIKKVLEMQIDTASGEVKKFAAYRKAYRKTGIFGSLRNLALSHLRKTWVDCESPAPKLRATLIGTLWQRAPIRDWPQTPEYLTASEKADLEETLLGLMPSPNPDDYTQSWADFRTPLHFAAYHGLEKFARQLIYALVGSAGSRALNRRDAWGETPLYYAVAQEQLALVELLLASKGIDTTITGREGTPKELAMLRVEEKCVDDSESCVVAKKIAELLGAHP